MTSRSSWFAIALTIVAAPYSLDRAAGQPARPVIFLWNGGPGSDSTTVHFTGFGPRRLRTTDDPAHPTPVTTELYDNDATWLTFADLVFVALFVPARTATAFYHKALAPELLRDEQATLKEAQAWALDTYAPAWEQRASLSDADRDRIIAGLAKYTGVPAAGIDRAALSMTSPQFTATLLKDRSVTLGRYDMRILQGAGAGGGGAGSTSRSSIILRYLRDDLGFKTDLTYQGLETGWSPAPSGRASGPGSRWVWNQGETALASGTDAARGANRAAVGSGDGPPGGSQPWMRRAMVLNSQLRLFVAAGQYDSLNSCADNSWTVSHLDPGVAKNITLGCYGGGHMMYDTKSARVGLRDDVEKFVKGLR